MVVCIFIVGFSIMVLVLYMADCNTHVLSPIFPICANNNHAHALWVTGALAGIQFSYALLLGLGAFLYLDILTGLIFMGTYVMKELL